jgi:hypothetical protein
MNSFCNFSRLSTISQNDPISLSAITNKIFPLSV